MSLPEQAGQFVQYCLIGKPQLVQSISWTLQASSLYGLCCECTSHCRTINWHVGNYITHYSLQCDLLMQLSYLTQPWCSGWESGPPCARLCDLRKQSPDREGGGSPDLSCWNSGNGGRGWIPSASWVSVYVCVCMHVCDRMADQMYRQCVQISAPAIYTSWKLYHNCINYHQKLDSSALGHTERNALRVLLHFSFSTLADLCNSALSLPVAYRCVTQLVCISTFLVIISLHINIFSYSYAIAMLTYIHQLANLECTWWVLLALQWLFP